MRLLSWLPWRFVLSRVARAHGFMDPVALLARLRRFTQPSEVAEPIELLRAGMVLHARGLMNSRVIQHNLDWVWPFWVERQFDPKDDAFVPRAFSVTNINLTHRNWTAIGIPDFPELPIVDPRGLVTPFMDGWSLDAWVITEDGRCLLPSRAQRSTQRISLEHGLTVRTETQAEGLSLIIRADVASNANSPVCRVQLEAQADTNAWAVFALRPYNPEGVSLVHEVTLSPDRTNWTIDADHIVQFDTNADRHHVSCYHDGDVFIHLRDLEDQHKVECNVGMATAAALFELKPHTTREVVAQIPLQANRTTAPVDISWAQSLDGQCQLRIPDERLQRLYETALWTLIVHSPDDVYPGPFTYKRFWFRDAAFIIHGLLCAGLSDRAERALDRFPARQTPLGYFHSQDGEWDSNGEVLWIMRRFCELTGRAPKRAWRDPIRQGARWIIKKRLPEDGTPHAGLLPAGFSAEHLGPNDYYYWDDFWGIAGLQAGAYLADLLVDEPTSEEFRHAADAFLYAVLNSLEHVRARLGRNAIPASPYRRLDAGAIGSLAVGYPLQISPPDDPGLLATAEFLLADCFVDGGFFQDMIHSGINPYLTLHVAQVLLRAGDSRYVDLMHTVADLASPTGQWPEAIHPHTRGGCMGDGQHVWAAAEWVMMMRNCFVREEGEHLTLASGVPTKWLTGGARLSFGPAPTSFGTVTVSIEPQNKQRDATIRVAWQAAWRKAPITLEVRLPGYPNVSVDPHETSVTLGQAP